MKFTCAKKGIYLIPATDADKTKFAKVAQGEIVQVEFEKKRNTQFHRKFFALLNIGFENQDTFNLFDIYREYVLIGIGFCHIFIRPDGQPNYKAKSISYENLPDNNDFEKVYNDAVSFIANQLSLTNEELTIEILSNF
jgi:hypothetical protein